MSDFKLRIVVGAAQIELAGEGELVHTIFQEVRENGLGELSSIAQANFTETQLSSEKVPNEFSTNLDILTHEIPNDAIESPKDLPPLQNVVLQGFPKKESEWLLVYAMYASNYGRLIFTKDDLHRKYVETNRTTVSRSNHFAENLKSLVSSKYISAVNETDFRIENAGLVKARSIILGESPDNATKKKNPAVKKRQATIYKMLELSLSEQERTSLREYWGNYDHSSIMDKAVLTAYWLKANKGISDFTADHFFTILRTIGESVNFDLNAAIYNAKNRKNYFVPGTEKGTYVLYHLGEDRVKELHIAGQQDN